MGRLESLTALALGRGPYEDEIVEWAGDENMQLNGQLYNEHGHPRNPETRRREREHVRAANEVMQVTGIVEDSIAAKVKAATVLLEQDQETNTGLRLIELGRSVLVAGVWGVLGLRRRILLYKPYSEVGILQILRQESARHGMWHVAGAGFPTVLAYTAMDWVAFFSDKFLWDMWGGEEGYDQLSPRKKQIKWTIKRMLDFGFCYITLHMRIFAILQQLNLVPSSRLLPSIWSFVPFTKASPLVFPITSSAPNAIASALGIALKSCVPFLAIFLHGKIKVVVSYLLYQPIFKKLPRPTGHHIFQGMSVSTPATECNTPVHPVPRGPQLAEDAPRALDGLPLLARSETQSRLVDRDSDSSADDTEMAQATLISFDVETDNMNVGQNQAIEGALGQWSAELRSVNEQPPREIRYRITGLTMLPPILATEGLKEVAAGIVVMPFEALMVRCVGKMYRASAHLGAKDMYNWYSGVGGWGGFSNILSALVMQVGISGIVWAGFTVISEWAARRQAENGSENDIDFAGSSAEVTMDSQ